MKKRDGVCSGEILCKEKIKEGRMKKRDGVGAISAGGDPLWMSHVLGKD